MKRLMLLTVGLCLGLVGHANLPSGHYYCNKQIGYCLDIVDDFAIGVDVRQKYSPDGFLIRNKELNSSLVIGGQKFGSTELSLDNKEQMLQVFAMIEETKTLNNWVTAQSIYTKNTATFIDNDGKETWYRHFNYDDKGFFEFVAKYANESEQQVKPMLEQMQNFIVWTDDTSQ